MKFLILFYYSNNNLRVNLLIHILYTDKEIKYYKLKIEFKCLNFKQNN